MTASSDPRASLPGFWQFAAAALLRGIKAGTLTVVTPDGRAHRFAGPEPGPVASMTVGDASVARRVLTGRDIALAETYMDGLWDTPDLRALLDFGNANLSADWGAGVPFVARPIQRLVHALRDNDARGGSRRNVSRHYDLGNDFYELWLDDTMTYSAACPADDATLPLSAEQLACAQRRKWDAVLNMIQPATGDRLLEIGCGWGGFAIHAAQEAGCRVTGITLSRAQVDHARARVRERGLDGQVEIRLQDYREVPGTYDGIASIEMFEAVGEKWWPTFFRRLHTLLEPGRAVGLQVITIADDVYEDYRRHPDFIQRYVFPGGMLPSWERFRAAAASAGLTAGEPRFFGRDYARTLAAWSERFEHVLPQVRGLGFDERFIRMWRYYLAYCRTGFEHGPIDVMQVRLES